MVTWTRMVAVDMEYRDRGDRTADGVDIESEWERYN